MPVKRTPTKPLPKAGETRRLPQVPAGKNASTTDEFGSGAGSGMVPDQWNAAIRLLTAVRDVLDRPVTLVQAFEILREFVRERGLLGDLDVREIRERLDSEEERAKIEKFDEQRRVAATAGKR